MEALRTPTEQAESPLQPICRRGATTQEERAMTPKPVPVTEEQWREFLAWAGDRLSVCLNTMSTIPFFQVWTKGNEGKDLVGSAYVVDKGDAELGGYAVREDVRIWLVDAFLRDDWYVEWQENRNP